VSVDYTDSNSGASKGVRSGESCGAEFVTGGMTSHIECPTYIMALEEEKKRTGWTSNN